MNQEPLHRVTIALISDLLFDARALVMSVAGVCVWLLYRPDVPALCGDDTCPWQITNKLKDDDLIGESKIISWS